MEINIVNTERELITGCITTIHWVAKQTEVEIHQTPSSDGVLSINKEVVYTSSVYGSLKVPSKSASDSTFIPFEDLTQTQVIQWVKNALGEEYIAELQNNLNTQIISQKHPVVVSGLPWATE
jgi:hypothetical protein